MPVVTERNTTQVMKCVVDLMRVALNPVVLLQGLDVVLVLNQGQTVVKVMRIVPEEPPNVPDNVR